MSEIIIYADLTWPEVETLDRNLPVILSEFDLHAIPWHKLFPDGAIIMPVIPYGWNWVGLIRDKTSFSAILSQIANCMLDQGFKNISLVTGSKIKGINPELKYVNFNQLMFGESREEPGWINDTGWNSHFIEGDRERVVLIPVGQVEQHGFHLPLSTDTDIVSAICAEVALHMPQRCLSLPVMPYGVSTHRKNFPGTLSCEARTFEDFCLQLTDSLVQDWGYQKIYFISGHGGNVSYLTNVVKAAGEKHPDAFIATSWLYLSGPDGIQALNDKRETAIGGMGHACELETSLMLFLRPETVLMEKVVDETDFISTPSYYMDWIEGGALIANPPWTDDTCTGAYGAGSKATEEKGAYWFEAAVKEKMSHVLEIDEQYQRRKKFRNIDKG